jgi:hypothetical protein
MVRHLVANSVLYDKKLSLQVIYPYKAFIQLNENYKDDSNNTKWCKSLCNLLLKQATELEHDVAFGELVDVLGLKGDLLAV